MKGSRYRRECRADNFGSSARHPAR